MVRLFSYGSSFVCISYNILVPFYTHTFMVLLTISHVQFKQSTGEIIVKLVVVTCALANAINHNNITITSNIFGIMLYCILSIVKPLRVLHTRIDICFHNCCNNVYLSILFHTLYILSFFTLVAYLFPMRKLYLKSFTAHFTKPEMPCKSSSLLWDRYWSYHFKIIRDGSNSEEPPTE